MDYNLFLHTETNQIIINYGLGNIEERVNLTAPNVLRKYLESRVVAKIKNFTNNNDTEYLTSQSQRFLAVDGTRLVVNNNTLVIRSNTVNNMDIHEYLSVAVKFYFASSN